MFATVLSLLILLVGLVSFNNLTVREYPRIDEPTVTVTTRFGGASSEVIESQVTKVLEDSLAGIEGVDIITSISRQEQSQITVRFKLERDPDSAAADVRDKVSRVRQRPARRRRRTHHRQGRGRRPPSSGSRSTDTVSSPGPQATVANRLIKPRLQTCAPAATSHLGRAALSMRLARPAAWPPSLTVQDVEDALRRSNLEVPPAHREARSAGVQRDGRHTDVQTPEQFAIGIRTWSGADHPHRRLARGAGAAGRAHLGALQRPRRRDRWA